MTGVAHICHATTTFDRRSGSARRTAAVLEACVAAGHRASLIVGRDHDLGDVPEGVEVTVLRRLAKPVHPVDDAAALAGLCRHLRSLRPDLVHTHLAKAGVLGRFAASLAGVPRIVHTVHGPTFPAGLPAARRRLYRAFERAAARRSHAMVYVGDELAASYLAAGVGTPAMSRVIRTGKPPAELDFTAPPATEQAALRRALCAGEACDLLLLHVGRLVPSKRPEHVLEVLAGLRRRGVDAHLVWVGDALTAAEKGYASRLRRRAAADPHVHFAGYRHDVLEIMSCADTVLLASSHEGLPNVAVEAVLAGTPVVGYAVLGLAEVVEHGRTGWIASVSEPAALVEGVLALRRERRRVAAQLAARRPAIARDYRRERMTKMTLALYRELLEAPLPAGGPS